MDGIAGHHSYRDQLQRIYEFPGGSVWDFFLAVLGVKKIPTTRERIEAGFESYLNLYNFTPDKSRRSAKSKRPLLRICLRKAESTWMRLPIPFMRD